MICNTIEHLHTKRYYISNFTLVSHTILMSLFLWLYHTLAKINVISHMLWRFSPISQHVYIYNVLRVRGYSSVFKMFLRWCDRKCFLDMPWIGLMWQPHLPKNPPFAFFTAIRTKPIWIYTRLFLLWHMYLISYIMLIHTWSTTVMYIYIYICYRCCYYHDCILQITYYRAMTVVANVTNNVGIGKSSFLKCIIHMS